MSRWKKSSWSDGGRRRSVRDWSPVPMPQRSGSDAPFAWAYGRGHNSDQCMVGKDVMEQVLQVVPGAHGVPVVHVPAACLWELVEYLSIQRVSVTYHFEQNHCTVMFPRSDVA